MNILIISHFFPPHKGGVETAAYYTAKNLSKLGHNVFVLTSKQNHTKDFTKKEENFTIFRYKSYHLPEIRGFPQSSHFGLILKGIFNLPKIIKKYNIHIIHLEGRFFPISVLAAFLNSIILKRPIILTIQGRLSGGYAHHVEFFYDTVIMKLIYSHVNRIICVSSSLKKHMIKSGGNIEKLKVIYNGVDTDFFKKLDSVSLLDNFTNSHKDYKKVIFVGRLDHQKGVEYLIRSIPKVLEEYEKVHFLILGNGNLESKLKHLARNLEIYSHTKFINMIPLRKMPEFYSSADIFCLPSLHEGFPLSIAEALSVGLIIVASDTEGIPEAIKENKNGYLVEPKNIGQLSQKLLKALNLDQDKIKKISQTNKKLAKNRYSWEIIVKRIVNEYLDCLKQPKS
ncbi:MAG: glycosyltransferase [Candidatus Lokiarchaeota archaeon]|nr:glycosyltransferase [Candidatus Lokiarchaeota archaeon]MBD3201169.1 glycosyltransferase [Candidatus Lokiarchaeota archaeon]